MDRRYLEAGRGLLDAWTTSQVTYHVALPFVLADDGVAPGEAEERFNPSAVVTRAEALSRKPCNVGAIAFSRSGDPATADFGDATIIREFGEVPTDLSDFQRCSFLTFCGRVNFDPAAIAEANTPRRA
jgi:hypothetical protein